MRKVGSFATPEEAKLFRQYLITKGIQSHLLDDDPSDLDVWIYADEELFEAKRYWKEFQESPDKRLEARQVVEAQAKVTILKPKAKPTASRPQALRYRRSSYPQDALVTKGLMGLIGIIYFLSLFDRGHVLFGYLGYSLDVVRGMSSPTPFFEISHGQLWRLVTPIFLHDGLLHILFNLAWLYQLGIPIEMGSSHKKFLGLVLFTAVVSNTVFYYLVTPRFEGLSGVVYGFIGYLWVKHNKGESSGLPTDEGLFRFFVIWYVLCWVLSAIGLGVANTIHGFGAASGILYTKAISGDLRWQEVKRSLKNKESRYTLLIILSLLVGGIVADRVLL